MNPLLLRNLLANKHTSGAALVYILAFTASEIAMVWWPNHAAQIKHTFDYIQKACVGYGLLMAGDAAAGQKQIADVDTKIEKLRSDTTMTRKE